MKKREEKKRVREKGAHSFLIVLVKRFRRRVTDSSTVIMYSLDSALAAPEVKRRWRGGGVTRGAAVLLDVLAGSEGLYGTSTICYNSARSRRASLRFLLSNTYYGVLGNLIEQIPFCRKPLFFSRWRVRGQEKVQRAC